MGIFFGLSAAVCWGIADFLARFATRRIGTYRASFFMQIIGFAALNAFVFALGGWSQLVAGAPARWQPWFWAAVAGVLNTGCSLAFYRSFEIGTLTVVAPITSSYPALTLLFAMLSGERLTWMHGVGVFVVVGGVALASTSLGNNGESAAQARGSQAHRHLTRGVNWAIAAACGFSLMFWVLGFRVMPALGGYASVWMIRLTTFTMLAFIAAPVRQSLRPPRGSVWWFLLGIGIFDTAAFLFNNMGLKGGNVAVVTVIASLYSAVTVFLAWIILRERLERSQWAGVFLIFIGIVLVSL